jgi:hypothetical protein
MNPSVDSASGQQPKYSFSVRFGSTDLIESSKWDLVLKELIRSIRFSKYKLQPIESLCT